MVSEFGQHSLEARRDDALFIFQVRVHLYGFEVIHDNGRQLGSRLKIAHVTMHARDGDERANE